MPKNLGVVPSILQRSRLPMPAGHQPGRGGAISGYPTRPPGRNFARGPEELFPILREPIRFIGPDPVPDGFKSPTTSDVEWIAFFWLWVVVVGNETSYGGPRNPKNWHGDPTGNFRYQKVVEGGRRVVGGSIADYLLYNTYYVRLVGERFHTHASNTQIVRDLNQKHRLNRDQFTTIDIFEQHVLVDWRRYNGGAHRVCADAARGIQWPDPITTGQTYRVRARLGD